MLNAEPQLLSICKPAVTQAMENKGPWGGLELLVAGNFLARCKTERVSLLELLESIYQLMSPAVSFQPPPPP